jgi:hypothetical protein
MISLPKGSGFRTINKMFGRLPKAVVLGLQEHIISSAQIHGEHVNFVLRIKLNSSMAPEK